MKKFKKNVLSILVVVTMLLSSMALFVSVSAPQPEKVIKASDTKWQEVNEFDLLETVFVEATGLEDATHYDVYVVPATIDPDQSLSLADVSGGHERFTTNKDGELEANVVWWYPEDTGEYKIVVDDNWNGIYDLVDLSSVITVTDSSLSKIYVAKDDGEMYNGFFYDEPIYAKGEGFSASQDIAIYVVEEQPYWEYNDPLIDVSGSFEIVKTDSRGEISVTCIWPEPKFARIGIYDVIADVDQNRIYSAGDAMFSERIPGITIAGPSGLGGHLEDEIASYGYIHQDYFDIGQKLYAYVNPSYRSSIPVGDQADIYVYLDRLWADGDPLNDEDDVSGGHETISPQFYCNNQWVTLIWPSVEEVEHGYYDVIIDCNQNGLYDIGYDLIDKHRGFGFTLTDLYICASNTYWQRVDTFDVFETVFAEARGLSSAKHYDVYVVPSTINQGQNLATYDVSGGHETFTTNMNGELEGNVVWWFPQMTGVYKIVVDDNWNGLYDFADLQKVITVTDLHLREVYVTDSIGAMDCGFFYGEPVYAKGEGFPPSTDVAIYVVAEKYDWWFGETLVDESGGPEIVATTSGGEIQNTCIWSMPLETDIGAYDVIVDVDRNGVNSIGDAMFSERIVGVTISGESSLEDHNEDEIASDYNYNHKDHFNVGERVYAYVNPSSRANIPIGSQADVYIYLDRDWTDGDPLSDADDVSGHHETISPQFECENQWLTLIWPSTQKIQHGYYDVIIDFDQDGVYDIGYDLLDKHMDFGFTLTGNDPINILYSDDVEIGERQWETLDDTGTWFGNNSEKCWYSGKGNNIRHDLQRKLNLTQYDPIDSMIIKFYNVRDLSDEQDDDDCQLCFFPEGSPIGSGPVWDDDTTGWEQNEYDVPSQYRSIYAGKNVTMDFIYQTDSNYLSEGWWVDDVEVWVNGNRIFFDDMESGTTGWQAVGWDYGYKTGTTGDYWHITNRDHHSSDSSWWCGDEGTGQYVSNLDNSLVMVKLPLLQHQAAWLRFWVKYDFNDAGDYVELEINYSETSPWAVLDTYTGSSGWVQKIYDFSGSYTGKSPQIRYQMHSDGSGESTGIFIDDIEVLVDEPQTAEWNYIGYFDGDNNLESCMIADLNELEFVGSTTHVNFFIMLDRWDGWGKNRITGQDEYKPGDDDISNGNWTGTRTYYVTPDDDGGLIRSFQFGPELDPTLFAPDAEHNMGSDTTLKAYVDWIKDHYPANKIVLVLSDHGGGINGICWDEDDVSDGDNLCFQDIENATTHITNGGTEPVEVLQLAVCLCQMTEMVYELTNDTTDAPYMNYLVASEEVSWGSSIPNGDFQDVAQYIVNNWNTVTGEQISTKMVDEYDESFNYLPGITMSAIDMSNIGDETGHLIGPLDDLATALTEALEDTTPPGFRKLYKWSIINATAHADHYADITNIDLYYFAEHLSNPSNLPGNGEHNYVITEAASAVRSCLFNTVVHNIWTMPHYHSFGLAIYFPQTLLQYSSDYDPFDLPGDTDWNKEDLFEAFWYAPSPP